MRLPAERNGARSSGHSLRHVRSSRKGKQQFRRRQTVGFFHQAFLGGIIYQEKNGRPSQPKRFMRVMASSRPQKERVSVISFGFEGTEIKGYSHGYGKHHRFQPEGIEHQEDAMQRGEPQQTQSENLGTQRNGARLTEIADIRSQQLVVQQPLVGSRRTAEKRAAESSRKGVVGSTGRKIPATPSASDRNPMGR